ncbi:hypothetical protein CTZ27_32085 [Streptomyces griseocarneus]|nr:hypothetical protein CTZ27_32085 [Streptomyces griseocarneus]
MLRAAAVLASTPAADPQRKAAEHDFTTSAPAARQAHGRIAGPAAAAQDDGAKLIADDVARKKYAETIEAGQRADTALRIRLRSRLSAVISGKDLLPVWFVTVLGPLPPACDPHTWMDTATDVPAYRGLPTRSPTPSSPSEARPTSAWQRAAPPGTASWPGSSGTGGARAFASADS